MISVNYKTENGKTSSVFVQRPKEKDQDGNEIGNTYSSEEVPAGKKSVVFVAARILEAAGVSLAIPCPTYSNEEKTTLEKKKMRLGLVVPASYTQAFEDQFVFTEKEPENLGE